MVAGDSIRERNIGIAPGFPIKPLNRHELITTVDIASVLGLKVGEQIQVDVSEISNLFYFIRFQSFTKTTTQ